MLISFLELLSPAITGAEGARIRSLVDFQICFSSPSPLPRAFGGRLLEGRSGYRPTSGEAWARHRSCRASSTTCTAESEGNPPASPPKSPDGRASRFEAALYVAPYES